MHLGGAKEEDSIRVKRRLRRGCINKLTVIGIWKFGQLIFYG
jgi:hypothetical protein